MLEMVIVRSLTSERVDVRFSQSAPLVALRSTKYTVGSPAVGSVTGRSLLAIIVEVPRPSAPSMIGYSTLTIATPSVGCGQLSSDSQKERPHMTRLADGMGISYHSAGR